MKPKSKEELKAIAIDIFKRYPKSKKVAVTSDGMAFITDDGDIAVKNHSVKNRFEKELSISRFTRDEIESGSGEKAKTAEELIAAINAATEFDVVEAILKAESEGKSRKTVIEAANAKLEVLKSSE